MKFWVASTSLLLLLVVSLLLLNQHGVSSRKYLQPYGFTDEGLTVQVVKSSPDVYSLWKEKGIRGRVVINMAEHLHFVPVDDGEIYTERRGFPVETTSLLEEHEGKISDENFLRVAMQAGIAREIYNVIPSPVMQEKLKLAAGQPGVKVSDREIVTHVLGSKRIITDELPDIDEPVVINIGASLFAHTEPEVLLKVLEESTLKTDMFTLCVAVDNSYVTEREQAKLMVFYDLLKSR